MMLVAERSEETGQTHDYIGQNGDQDIGTAHASQQSQIKEYERRGQGPVDIASPEHLADDGLDGVWNSVPVVLMDKDVIELEACAGGHGEVREGCDDGDHGSDDMVNASGLDIMSQIGALGRGILTSGTGQAIPMKAIEAMTMMTNTTLESSEHQAD
jgi:hypothetical protein